MIVLACDPGATTGWAIVDMTGARPRIVSCGHWRAKPETLTEMHEIATEHFDLVAVESVQKMYYRDRFSAAMATAIQNATRIEERILAAARARNIPTAICTAAEARAAIAGARNASDARIKMALQRQVDGLPKRTSSHARDAIVTGIFCGRRHRVEGLRRAVSR